VVLIGKTQKLNFILYVHKLIPFESLISWRQRRKEKYFERACFGGILILKVFQSREVSNC
jgi:hypothetical protein